MSATRFCPVCGAANEPRSTLCYACGQAMGNEADVMGPQEETSLYGRYRLSSLLGSGGFSAVYRAQDLHDHGREVAIKQITLHGLEADRMIEATATFNREIDLLAALNHPQVPRLFDQFHDTEHWYLVLEYIPGSTLETYLARHTAQDQPLPLDDVLEMTLQLCNVLAYLHSLQPPVIFRDLKPGNIMRTPAGQLYLIDFGIARRFRQGQAHDTQPLGSPGYAAPEQYGRAQTTPSADLYSLGALLCTLLTGRDASEQAPNPAALTPLREHGHAAVLELARHLLAHDPNERPASAREVAQALSAIQQERAQRNQTRLWSPPPPQVYAPPPGGQRLIQISLPAPSYTAAAGRRWRRRSVLAGALALTAVISSGAWWQRAHTWPTSPYPYTYTGHKESVTAVAWAPNGQHIASASQDTTLQIWNPADAANVQILQGPASGVNGLSWSPDGRHIAAAYGNGEAYVWDRRTRARWLFAHHTATVNSVAWSPRSTLVASASDDTTVRLWHPFTGYEFFVYRGHSAAVTSVAWSPDSTLVASASNDGDVQVWHISGQRVAHYAVHRRPVYSVAWSPDGQHLVLASHDGTLQVWQPSAEILPLSYRQHSGPVLAVAWSPDGASIASGSFDTTVSLWSAQSKSTSFIYRGHTAQVNALSWSPDGTAIASSSSDTTVQVWRVAALDRS